MVKNSLNYQDSSIAFLKLAKGLTTAAIFAFFALGIVSLILRLFMSLVGRSRPRF